MRSLRNLVLRRSGWFPKGPYLTRLERLSLRDYCDYDESIPSALQGADELQNLEVTQPTGFSNDDNDAALVTILPAALKTLTLVYANIRQVTAEQWNHQVSHMRAVFVAKGRVPPDFKCNLIIVPLSSVQEYYQPRRISDGWASN